MSTTSSRQSRRRVPAAQRRDALIAAAIEEFALGGLHGTPVERIASRVGVAQPYVFSLFSTKRDLFIAAVEQGFQLVMDLFAERAAEFTRIGGGSREELMRSLGERYIETLATSRPKLMFQLQAYAACDDETIRAHVRAMYERLAAQIGELTGSSADEVSEFLSHGMWLSVQAAIGNPDLEAACQWIRGRQAGDVQAG